MAIADNIQNAILRARASGRIPTEVFMSSLTRDHLKTQLPRYESTWSARSKPVNATPSELARRVPTEIYGLKIRIKDSISTDSFILEFKKLREVIDYKTGRKEHVAEPER